MRYALTLGTPIACQVRDLLLARFTGVRTTADPALLVVDGLDQSALRALLTLLWDTGNEVLAVNPAAPPGVESAAGGAPPPRPPGPSRPDREEPS
jgi:hypothetical protein